eukprot:COSAG02_NODE_33410_length_500_cov_1.127182_1_plen_45_part_01
MHGTRVTRQDPCFNVAARRGGGLRTSAMSDHIAMMTPNELYENAI